MWFLRSLFDKNLGEDSLGHYCGGADASVSRMRREHPFQSDDVIAAFYRPRADCPTLEDQVDSLNLDDAAVDAPAPISKGKPVKRVKGLRKAKRPLHGKRSATLAPATNSQSPLLNRLYLFLDDPHLKPRVSIGQSAESEGLLLPVFFAYAEDVPRMRIALDHLFQLDPHLRTARAPIGTWTKLWLTGHPEDRQFIEDMNRALADRPEGNVTYAMALALLALVTWNREMLDLLLDGNYGIPSTSEFTKFASNFDVASVFLPLMITRFNNVTAVPAMLDHLMSLGWKLDRSKSPYCFAIYAGIPDTPELFSVLFTKYDAPCASVASLTCNIMLIGPDLSFVMKDFIEKPRLTSVLSKLFLNQRSRPHPSELSNIFRGIKRLGLAPVDVIEPAFWSLMGAGDFTIALTGQFGDKADKLSLLDLALDHAVDPKDPYDDTATNAHDECDNVTMHSLTRILRLFLRYAPVFTLHVVIDWDEYLPKWMWRELTPVLQMHRDRLPSGVMGAAWEGVALRKSKGDLFAATFLLDNIASPRETASASMDDMSVE
ncbi:hypothetical protein H9P43_009355 [Blastocladiella emersonii ATCC 22665]|nr:hypothetical protein H9P43_009355 [Blastocladiella emersonii ATCC 22665]